ncbi:MAG: ferritin family protein [Candidatus Eremiobacteraeota bacterium]|nr:ferritin family protein [Candidatus Eremiobacteraeota bacterium]
MPFSDLSQVLNEFGISKDSAPVFKFHKDYSGYEIVILATEIEKMGYAYYKLAQKLAPTIELSEVFKNMALDELDHIKILNRDIAPLFRKSEYHWENEETVARYLSRTTDQDVFMDMDELKRRIEKIKTEGEALDLCIEGEKLSIAFYKKVFDQTSGKEGRTAICHILDEEKKHVEKLENLKEELKG